MISPVSYTTKNCFLFYKEHRNGILIIFAQSKELELKFSSAYKTCLRTNKEFSIKNYNRYGRKLTSGVALCEWRRHLWKITSRQMVSTHQVPEEFLIFYFFLGLKIIVVFCWRLELQGSKWVLVFCMCSSFCIFYLGKVWSGSTQVSSSYGVERKLWRGMRGRDWVQWDI